MTIYFKDGGFYQSDNGGFVPDGAVIVKNDDYILLIEGQASGKQIITNNNGYPVLIDPRPSPYHTLNGIQWEINKEQKAAKKAEEISKVRDKINALRDKKNSTGVYVESLGKWFDNNEPAYQNLLGFKASIDLIGDTKTAWICADNSVMPNFGKSELTAVIAKIMQDKTANVQNALVHKMALEHTDNPEEYDYSTGWTKTYEDYIKEQQDEK